MRGLGNDRSHRNQKQVQYSQRREGHRRGLRLSSLLSLLGCILVVWLLWMGNAWAGPIADRIAAFPDWRDKPPVQAVEGELIYPDWFAGNWTMTSTLVELTAPLAPEVVTPGFESNQQYLNKPVASQVRFVPEAALARSKAPLPLLWLPTRSLVNVQIVADRAFNGLNLAKTYLGDQVFRVWTDPRDATRLITKFRNNRKLFSTTTGRAVEQPDAERFMTSEMVQQFFQAADKPFKNQVETTTAYTHQPDGTIAGDQITAVYLTTPHPKAYLAGDRPVALYRYRLEFSPLKKGT